MKVENTVYIAFGANKGEPIKNIQTAIKLLGNFGTVKQVSPLFKTKPEGFLQQQDFVNGALEFETELSPTQLLAELKRIEQQLGRAPSFRNAPREIDLDILFYGNITLNTPNLTIPHPLCAQREFVLRPLNAIAAHFIHPVSKTSVNALLAQLMLTKQLSDCQEITGAL